MASWITVKKPFDFKVSHTKREHYTTGLRVYARAEVVDHAIAKGYATLEEPETVETTDDRGDG